MKPGFLKLSVVTTFCLFAVAANARASIIQYTAILTGPSEIPVNTSPGTGFGTFVYDDVAHTLQVQFSFSGLEGYTTATHIHAATVTAFTGTAGVATTTPTFDGLLPGVTSGSYSNILDLTSPRSYNPSYETANGGTTAGAEVALAAAMAGGKSYLNIHSTKYGGGEIRGFLVRLGDVNHDTAVTTDDIDAVYANFGTRIGHYDARYDLDNSGAVDQADVDMLARTLLHTNYGDANLDNKVNFIDFQAILDHWQNGSQGWAGGDFNGDRTVNFLDFQSLLDNWSPIGAAEAPVPEPATLALLAIGGLALVRGGKRR